MSDSYSLSDLSKTNQRTVRRLWKQKPVSIDKITGLFNTIEDNFYAQNRISNQVAGASPRQSSTTPHYPET